MRKSTVADSQAKPFKPRNSYNNCTLSTVKPKLLPHVQHAKNSQPNWSQFTWLPPFTNLLRRNSLASIPGPDIDPSDI